jgi:hypothetical protein
MADIGTSDNTRKIPAKRPLQNAAKGSGRILVL